MLEVIVFFCSGKKMNQDVFASVFGSVILILSFGSSFVVFDTVLL